MDLGTRAQQYVQHGGYAEPIGEDEELRNFTHTYIAMSGPTPNFAAVESVMKEMEYFVPGVEKITPSIKDDKIVMTYEVIMPKNNEKDVKFLWDSMTSDITEWFPTLKVSGVTYNLSVSIT